MDGNLDSVREWQGDAVLGPLLRQAAGDEGTLGVLLTGSRGAGLADEHSDYDVIFVLTEDAFAARKARGEPAHVRDLDLGSPGSPGGKRADLSYTTLRRLADLAARPGWRTYAYVASKVLLDKTGEVTRAVAAIAAIPEAQAQADVPAWLDAYLNAFYRALKAARRGNDLGARLHAAASVMHLVQALFRLERRWPPYLDYLGPPLETLAGQGWRPGELRDSFLAILRAADVDAQRRLEARVEVLMRARGYGHVLDAWGGDLERVKGAW